MDMTNNRVPYGLLTEEEKEYLKNYEGDLEWCHPCYRGWQPKDLAIGGFYIETIYRTVPPQPTTGGGE